MQIQNIKVSELRKSEYNPRKASEQEWNELKKSIERFGIVDPIIVNRHSGRENVIVGGHFRVRVAESMGIEEVPVVYVDLDPEREKELNLRLNKNLGEWDWDLLAGFEESFLLDVGFQKVELHAKFGINQEAEEDGFDAEAEYAAIKEPISKLGEVYQLGRHRLMCGDSTNPEHVAVLMNGALANTVFTDPPYNVDYGYEKYKAIHHDRKEPFLNSGKIFNDDKTPEEFYQFLLTAFRNAYRHTTDDMAMYVCHATKTQEQFFQAFADAGFHFSQTIIWLKERIILNMGQDYHRVYEPIIFGWKTGQSHFSNHFITTEKELWDLDRLTFEERLDVWYEHRDKSSQYEHPTQKPCRRAGRALQKSCSPDGSVLDLFGGSGSTLIAAEQMNQTAYLMELDPAYCDVIRKRYERVIGVPNASEI